MTFLRVANRRQRVAVVDAAVSCSQDRGREGSSHSRGASADRRVKAASATASASASPTTICGEGNDGVNDQPHGLQHDRDFRVVNKTSGEPNDDDASVVTDLSQRSRSSSSTATSLSLSSHLSLSLNLSDRERPASSTSSSLPHHPESAEEVLADDQATNCDGHSRNEDGNDDDDDDSDELSVTSAASASSSCSSSSSSSSSSAAAGQVSRQRSRDGQQPQKRTIFRYYWEKTGQAPLQLQRYDPRPPTFVPAGDGFMHSAQSTMPNTSSRAAASAEASAHRAAAADSAPSRISQSTAASNGNPCAQSDAKGSCRGERQSSLQSQLPRRSILPRNSYASTPTLCMDSSPAGNPMRRHSAQRPDGSMMPLLMLQRKALSTSHLQQGGFHDSSSSLSSSCSTRSKRSCLRQTRYSGSMRRTPEQQPASSDATTVSFDAVVNVQLFHRPIEQHAANGW
eukprot:CAMPEP_0119547526 /NCGR_PEP_ID=MMETSP1352-20130426/1630_1 /TAXON_ID=265584 /ORGANISM="Stauroneis constricta, Strain CCMP1120" /LENGTH=454 /DNA_ID=CAMNT_0007592473 /DNA_START=154 /DNA_END=1515 /DNA_ORIENTATION=-